MESALSVREKLFSIRILWATTPLLRIIVCKARNVVQEIDRVPDSNINNYALRLPFTASFTHSTSRSRCGTMYRAYSIIYYTEIEKERRGFQRTKKKNDGTHNWMEDDGLHWKDRQISRVSLEFKTPCIGNRT